MESMDECILCCGVRLPCREGEASVRWWPAPEPDAPVRSLELDLLVRDGGLELVGGPLFGLGKSEYPVAGCCDADMVVAVRRGEEWKIHSRFLFSPFYSYVFSRTGLKSALPMRLYLIRGQKGRREERFATARRLLGPHDIRAAVKRGNRLVREKAASPTQRERSA